MGSLEVHNDLVSLTIGFDLDLTLVDSRERVLGSYLAAFADLGASVRRQDLVPHLGLPLVHTGELVAPQVPSDALVEAYRRHYAREDQAPHAAMPGARSALESVREAGGRSVVISAKFGPAVVLALAEAGLADLVDGVHAERFGEGKSQAVVEESAQVYVGDHAEDMRSARGAGAVGVGVATGTFDEQALSEAGADVVLADLREFAHWLRARSGLS